MKKHFGSQLALVIGFTLGMASTARAETPDQKERYKNLTYTSLVRQQEILSPYLSVFTASNKKKIPFLAFSYEVKSPRDQASGLSSGKRQSQSLRPEMPTVAQAIVNLLKTNDSDAAIVAWKGYLKDLSKVNHPVDINDEVYWIIRETYLKQNLDLDSMVLSLADSIHKKEAARKRQEELEAQRAPCDQNTNVSVCDQMVLQRINTHLEEIKTQEDAISELANGDILALTEAMDKKDELESLISSIMQKMDETASSVIANLK